MFEAMIGHKTAVDALRRQVENGRLAHAYLFIGPEGVGKTTAARMLLGLEGQKEGIAEVDGYVITRDADEKTGKLKSLIGVDQVRALRDRLSLTSFGGGRKVAFIEEADRLSDGAANALLKTLEEPRGDTVIVLRAETLESVPATIASRCQVVRFHPVSAADIASAMIARGVARAEAEELAAAARGRPGIALRLLVDNAFRAERATALATFDAILAASLPKRLSLVADLLPKSEADKATALEKILDAWEEAARNKMLAGDGRFVAILDRLRAAREASDHNVNPQLALEHIVI